MIAKNLQMYKDEELNQGLMKNKIETIWSKFKPAQRNKEGWSITRLSQEESQKFQLVSEAKL